MDEESREGAGGGAGGGESVQEQDARVLSERTELEEMQESLQETRNYQAYLQDLLATITASMEHAELLKEKLVNPNASKGGKTGPRCGVKKGKDNLPCTNPGKLQSGLFCGTHAACATSEAFGDVLAKLHVANIAALLASTEDRTVQLTQYVLGKKGEMNEALYQLEVTKREVETLAKTEKEKKEVIKKLRGPRVAQLFKILEEEIGVMFSHRGGEFSMVGNCCRRALDRQTVFLRVIADQPDLFDKFSGLFQRMKAVVDILFQISPLRTIQLTAKEQGILEAVKTSRSSEISPVPASAPEAAPEAAASTTASPSAPSPPSLALQMSELEHSVFVLEELQEFFVIHFNALPIPKQHFLCFHATQFLKRWLTIGMFAEQAIESIHAIVNKGKSTYRALGAEGAKEKTLHSINARFEEDPEAFKLRKHNGKKGRPFGGGGPVKKNKRT